MSKNIKNDEIAIVVQGPVQSGITTKSLKSLKKVFPSSQVILSTWEGQNVTNLQYNHVILNKDPGAEKQKLKGAKPGEYHERDNNINRMIFSCQSGIDYINRYLPEVKYILKVRSDMLAIHGGFLKYFNKFEKRDQSYSLFKNRIIAYPYVSLLQETIRGVSQHALFHVSDFCYFGYKEDITELFNIPLVKEPEFTKYFETHGKNKTDIFDEEGRTWAMSPEQYIISTNAKKILNFEFDNYLDTSSETVNISFNFIMDNFIFLYDKQHGIYHKYNDTYVKTVKDKKNQVGIFITFITHKLFIQYYKKLDPSYRAKLSFLPIYYSLYLKIRKKILKRKKYAQ